jgi:hypothetical protein
MASAGRRKEWEQALVDGVGVSRPLFGLFGQQIQHQFLQLRRHARPQVTQRLRVLVEVLVPEFVLAVAVEDGRAGQ